MASDFEWDEKKNKLNQLKHGLSFIDAQKVFKDINRIILKDEKHSTTSETRYFCIGKIDGSICTVRFTVRDNKIRIIGAGYWRRERGRYEKSKR